MQQRARAIESNRQPAADRGAAASAPRSTPLTLVSGAVAGDDLQSVASAASQALGLPVAIMIPAAGELVVSPPGGLEGGAMRDVIDHAAALIRGDVPIAPSAISEAVAVRIGEQIVGIVAAAPGPAGVSASAERLAWLEAAAAAAAVASLMRETQEGGLEGSRRALLQALSAGAPDDIEAFVGHARRLGFELGSGAVAICAQCSPGEESPAATVLRASEHALIADMGGGRVLGLVTLAAAEASEASGAAPGGATDVAADPADELAAALAAQGMVVAMSTPRRDPAALHEAVREAELLVELAGSPDAPLAGQEETYRLLIGVLLRDAEELKLLRAHTISPLARYDDQHDTDLLATLQAFLFHHGSTTETAEAMHLHRHTVGYRLSRVHEVSGLSPYESDGRERLSLGLKAHQILTAAQRLSERE
jgi:hypothetical protein